jgi:hypothetical protein
LDYLFVFSRISLEVRTVLAIKPSTIACWETAISHTPDRGPLTLIDAITTGQITSPEMKNKLKNNLLTSNTPNL